MGPLGTIVCVAFVSIAAFVWLVRTRSDFTRY